MTVISSACICAERRRPIAVVAGLVVAAALAGCGAARAMVARRTPAPAPRTRAATREAAAPYPIGELTVHWVDRSRTVTYPGHRRQARPLTTVIRYPEHVGRRVGLIVFGHGYAVTPAAYWRLLRAWAQAGYVVAAPVFPLENAHAPGAPNESDLVNQPRDMSFVITHTLALSAARSGPLAGLITPGEVAVSGQSDGGETALATAYDRAYLDPRIRAAAILSGAELPGAERFYFPRHSPPLLATQGTADTVNPPHFTYQFFSAAPRPKFLLKLLGAPHLPPYTVQQPQLGIVERVTLAFFGRYLEGRRPDLAAIRAAGNVPGRSALSAEP
jgi:dienelactone hydrolase